MKLPVARACLVVVLLASLLPCAAQAQLRSEVVARGLSQPVGLVPDPIHADVLYILEKDGLVRVLRGRRLEDQPFLDLRDVVSTDDERGLLGMAFSPDIATGRVFLTFADATGNIVLSRFQRQPGAPFHVDATTRFDFRWPTGEPFIRHPSTVHYGGQLAFGPDGYLYVGWGDGGSPITDANDAQNPFSLLGKMLRLDVAVGDDHPVGYLVPEDNPFVDGAPIPAFPEIWSFGLRNPWRFSFDDFGHGATGAMMLADVGEVSREEINYEPAGASGRNYGWPVREGRLAVSIAAPARAAYSPLTEPAFDYDRSVGRAVIGGFAYRGAALGPAYRGRYFFADFMAARVWSMALSGSAAGQVVPADLVEHTGELGPTLGRVSSFGRDRSGELYVLTIAGHVLKIVPALGGAPTAPDTVTAYVDGSTVTVAWVVPPSEALAISAYQVEVGSSPDAADLGVYVLDRAQTSIVATGVPAGTYFVSVRTVVGGGVSERSPEVAVVVGNACTPPEPPSHLESAVTGFTVTLRWNPPPGAPLSTHFHIEAGETAGSSNIGVLAIPAGLQTVSVLAPSGTYFVRVRSTNDCGSSGPSNEIVVTVPQ